MTLTTNEQVQMLKISSAEEAAQTLQEANAKNRMVGFIGGGTKQTYGNLPAPLNLQISTKNLNELIAYQPEDLTVTVGAGMEFDQLQTVLSQHNQWLPLDPPLLPGATLGGNIAVNSCGPKRLLYGTLRDLLIGCQFVLADGSIGRSGGRVVKNVTGYDLHKLFIGSLGTLGLLTEVTFKVLPKPEFSQWGIATFEKLEDALTAARKAAGSNTTPAALEIFDRPLTPNAEQKTTTPTYNLYFAAEGVAVAVRDQIAALSKLCREYAASDVKVSASPEEAQEIWSNLQTLQAANLSNVQLKWSSKLTDLPSIFKDCQRLVQELNLDAVINARAGTGNIYLYAKADDSNYDQLVTLIESSRNKVQLLGGSLVIEKAPSHLKEKVEVFGSVGDALPAMKALKDKLDPKGILNSGRFLKGL